MRGSRTSTGRDATSGRLVLVLSLCGIVVSLQQTLVLPLLPDLPRLLGTTADNATWLVTATLLAGAIATPTVGRLADLYGRRRMMLWTLAVSVLGSVLGAVTTALPALIGARVLQGIGMALVPVGIAVMRDELPRDRLPLGVAMLSTTLAIGAGLGPPVAGVVADRLDWHAMFWLTGAFGLLLLVMLVRTLPVSAPPVRRKFDLRGAVLLTLALTPMLLALSKGSQWGWLSGLTLGCALGGLALLLAWVPLEWRTPSPLVDVRVAARPAVLLANGASVLCGFSAFANLLVTAQFLQIPRESGYGLGLSVTLTGLWMIPQAAAFGVVAPVSAWVTRRFGAQWAMLTGAATMAVAYAFRPFLSQNLPQIVLGSVVVAAGTAMAYGAAPLLISRIVPATETASANGLNVLVRSIGQSTSSAALAVAATVGAVGVGGLLVPGLAALTTLFWLAAASAAVAVLLSTAVLRHVREEPDQAADLPAGPSALAAGGGGLDGS
ncbi:MFS transporter [Pseudonocardia ailaonensis]|uniref:MFS transporter n=1 Tax=Pseudonocardia ailaonensis TaxID=367279 RepID=A0ABN2NGS9_9PSEU